MKLFFLFLSMLIMNSPDNSLVFNTLGSYFIGNNITIKGSKQTWILKNEKDFDKIFHPAALNGQSVEAPDFEHEIVLAIAFQPSNNSYDLKVVKIEKTSNTIKVYYSIDLKAKNLSFTQSHFVAVTIPKEDFTGSVKFYLLKQLSKAK
jgi:hypothetical protein